MPLQVSQTPSSQNVQYARSRPITPASPSSSCSSVPSPASLTLHAVRQEKTTSHRLYPAHCPRTSHQLIEAGSFKWWTWLDTHATWPTNEPDPWLQSQFTQVNPELSLNYRHKCEISFESCCKVNVSHHEARAQPLQPSTSTTYLSHNQA